MILKDFLETLALGVLSQVSAGKHGNVDPKDYPTVITYINMGLTQLHTKLDLRREQALILTNSFTRSYTLTPANAASSGNQNAFILDDTSNPFNPNILVIDQVIGQEFGEYSLNDSKDEYTVFTPKYNSLQFSIPTNERVSVLYRADHPTIQPSRSIDTSTVDIDIPNYLTDALATFVGSCIVGNGGNAESTQEGLLLLSKFNQMLEQIEAMGLIQPDMSSNDLIWRNGWA